MEQKFCRNICYRAAYRHLDNLCFFSRARIKTWMSVKSNNCFLGANHHMPMLVCTSIDHGAYVSFCKYRYTHFKYILVVIHSFRKVQCQGNTLCVLYIYRSTKQNPSFILVLHYSKYKKSKIQILLYMCRIQIHISMSIFHIIILLQVKHDSKTQPCSIIKDSHE